MVLGGQFRAVPAVDAGAGVDAPLAEVEPFATAAGVVAVVAPAGVLLVVAVLALAGVLVVLVALAPAGVFVVVLAFTAPLGIMLAAVVEVIGQGLPLPGRVVVEVETPAALVPPLLVCAEF